ncbi:hypothetical protein DMB38_11225 [Streptomyces sp. WAC 06738]|uniref:hypothetical protein n=1 Tax=Streptomyces sp. WAC 06738 TaxID=2203210 RepID=UPI000F6EBA9C|nr:hypothetical protein [Streptomyces sp. WAC 06738]AZM46314.1 hypothetical protein DMB38_11225 [Streptomyces sp. WAC 06738]
MARVRCALVVPHDAHVDEELLQAVAMASGKEFSVDASGMFGIEVLATLYSDEAGDLLIEAQAVEVPVKAVLVRTAVPEDAVAIRQVVGDRLHGWSEQMIRARIEAEPDGDPQLMVALAMAVGGGSIEQESLSLLQRAAVVDDEKVRGLAAYALQVAADLADPPIVRKEEERELADVLRPRAPVDDGDDWVTARPGISGRQIPRPVTWLRGADASKAITECSWDDDWLMEVAGDTRSDWYEDIWITENQRTAIHKIEHPALGGVHIAVHGMDTTAIVAALGMKGDLEVLDTPPDCLPRTAP